MLLRGWLLQVFVSALMAQAFSALPSRAWAAVALEDQPTGPGYYRDPHRIVVAITGEITGGDFTTLADLLNSTAFKTLSVKVDSTGGSVLAAMDMGRLLRKNHAHVSFRGDNAVCFSSCVLLVAGATSRLLYPGQVGIHRPFDSSLAEMSFEQRQSVYSSMRDAVEHYLRDMNIPESLFLAMQRVPPENMRVLTFDEQKQFGLWGTDPVEEEMENANAAKKYGITMLEYLGRKAVADKNCFTPAADIQKTLACENRIMWGLSSRQATEREKLVDTVCGSIDDDAWEDCYVKVMRSGAAPTAGVHGGKTK